MMDDIGRGRVDMAEEGFVHDGGSVLAQAAWVGLGESMGRVRDDLSSVSTVGLPADVASAGTAFLRRWSELAEHSRRGAERRAGSLELVDRRYRVADEGVRSRFDHIRSRMSG